MSEPEKVYGCPEVNKRETPTSYSVEASNQIATVLQFKKLPIMSEEVIELITKAAEKNLIGESYILPTGEHLDKAWFINDWCNVYKLFIWRGKDHLAKEFIDNIMETAKSVHDAFYEEDD